MHCAIYTTMLSAFPNCAKNDPSLVMNVLNGFDDDDDHEYKAYVLKVIHTFFLDMNMTL